MSIDLSQFARSVGVEEDASPAWVSRSSSKVKQLYQEVLKERDIVLANIKNQGSRLSINDRRVVPSRLALACCVDRSYLTSRRVPELMDYIRQINDDLDNAWKNRTNRNAGLKSLTRKELESEVSNLRKTNQRLLKDGLKRDLEKAIEVLGLEDRLELVAQTNNLKQLLQEKNNTIANLRSQLREATLKLVSN